MESCFRHMYGRFPGGSGVKNLCVNEGDAGLISGQEDPLKKEIVARSSNPAWQIPWTEDPGELQSTGLQKSGTSFQD